jgi:transposase
VTTALATTYGTVVVEDLNVAGMTARPAPRPDPHRPGHHLHNGARARAGLNRAILDASPGELRRQLAYKCEWYGSRLVVEGRGHRLVHPTGAPPAKRQAGTGRPGRTGTASSQGEAA